MAEMCRYNVCFLIIACAIISSNRISAQFESGDLCTKGGSPGICKLLANCSPAMADIKKGIYPQICGFQGSKSIVCCVELEAAQSTVGEKSLKKCREYARYAYLKEESPTFSVITKYIHTLMCSIDYAKLIVGGSKARKSEFPHMAQLGYMIDGEIIYACGGSLISENYVLTASHCFKHRKGGQPRVVRVGVTKQTVTSLAQIRNVVEVIKHPNYRSKYHDIGLLRVDKNFDFNPAVRPACLYTKKDFPFENAIAAGWGKTGYTAKESNDLMKVILKFASADECNAAYADLPNGIDDNLMVCAGNDHKDTCQGDSGGPLQIYHENTEEIKCMYNIIGVTAFGKACGIENAPGVYTRVSNYLNWIENIVWKD